MAILGDWWNAIRYLFIVILDKIEPDKDAVYLFCDYGVLAQRRRNVRASAEAAWGHRCRRWTSTFQPRTPVENLSLDGIWPGFVFW